MENRPPFYAKRPSLIHLATDPQTAWAAGLFEGEGYIQIRNREYGRECRLSLEMTDEDVVAKFARICGGYVTGPKTRRSTPHSNRKPTWSWAIYRKDDVVALLQAFLPYLGKRRAAKAREALKD